MGMVRTATALGRSGLQDWLFQRLTALVLALFTLFLFIYFCMHPNLSYTDWKNLFSSYTFRVITLIALLSLMIHAWIGIWTVTTDYLKTVSVRLIIQSLFILGLLFCLIWGINIVWTA